MIAADILLDGLFAAIAAIGFGAVSDPPMRAFPRIALLAAMGHALRFCLMHYFSVDIATASLFASISIGFGLSLIHISEPTRLRRISYVIFSWTKHT